MEKAKEYSFIDNAKLNPAQREAVAATEGGVLVLAGAGSGKTRVLTHRVVHLIKDLAVPPWNILAITFTNKAAGEMKERINDMCGYEGEGVWVSTFHSMCVRILKTDIHNIGYDKNFSIYDEDDSLRVITEILKEKNIEDFKPKAFKGAISSAKNKMTPYEYIMERKNKGYGEFADLLPDIYLEYERRLKKNNALDFDDLLLRTIELFEKCPGVLEKYQRRFKYIMVDEYQDTNYAQYILVKMLGGYYHNVCVVGDDDQSIYGWRGADISNIRNFEKDYKDAKVIKLEQNYRSTNNILKAANAVIRNNADRKEKTLWSDKEDGEKITLARLNDEKAEAGYVSGIISEQVKKGAKYSDYAILYRINSVSRNFEEALAGRGIPYRIYGGQRFYDRKEIKDALAYMKLVLNPNDEVALKRIVNVPRRGIGTVTMEEIESIARENEDSIFGVMLEAEQYGLEPKLRRKFTQFVELMQELIVQSALLPLGDYIEYMFTLTGLVAQYEKDKSEEAQARIDNLHEMISAARQFSAQNPGSTLEDYMEHVSLVTELEEQDSSTGRGAVNLMTLHSAKGLEFDTVFLAAMEDGIFPLSRAIYEPSEMEEERRLCYVGITRAMRKLYITGAENRFNYREKAEAIPSRFIREIPDELILRQGRPSLGAGAFNRRRQESVRPSYNMGALGVGGGAQQPEGNREQLYKTGMKVAHKSFGQGIIIDVRDDGRNVILKIVFPGKGIKELSAKHAPLTIL